MKIDKIVIIGLGYVGLPLAVRFSKYYEVIGFDNEIDKIKNFNSNNFEINRLNFSLDLDDKKNFKKIKFTSNPNDISGANFYIITVPTPVNQALKPDLSHLIEASNLVGKALKKNSIVIYESTVFPGATEEVCLPILEDRSGLKTPNDFGLGYSPERINPGDSMHNVQNVNKLISSNSKFVLKKINLLYKKIIDAEIIQTSSIKVAETSKVIENTQRDLNIGLMNELAMICNKLDIDTHEVIKAASTKWNFLPFYPGLVGGHCISVDPYYLTYRAKLEGISPDIILAGRRVNDNMWKFVVENTLKLITKNGSEISKSKIGILGITFKENCEDFRNSQVVKIYNEFLNYNMKVFVHDPVVDKDELYKSLSIKNLELNKFPKLDILIFAVSHNNFKKLKFLEIKNLLKNNGSIIDVKSVLKKEQYKKIPIWKI